MRRTQAEVRTAILKYIAANQRQPGYCQQGSILREVVQELRTGGAQLSDTDVLDAWYELFRTGILAPGFDLSNDDLPFVHLTKRGQGAVVQLSRDPSNPDGYLAYLTQKAPLNATAASYVDEALLTYNNACFKASAVMIGAAAESVALEVRDALVAGLTAIGQAVPGDLKDWRIKRFTDAIEQELLKHIRQMPPGVGEAFPKYWPAFVQQIRAVRNDAGHPDTLAGITPESVHACLLIFPELMEMNAKLLAWIPQHFK